MSKSSLGDRFSAAHRKLLQVKKVRVDLATPAERKRVLDQLSARTSFNLAEMSATLFPNGLVTDLDPAKPDWIKAWTEMRTGSSPILVAALDAYTTGPLDVDTGGLTLHMSEADMLALGLVAYPHDEIVDLFVGLGLGFRRVTNARGPMPFETIGHEVTIQTANLSADLFPFGMSRTQFVRHSLVAAVSEGIYSANGNRQLLTMRKAVRIDDEQVRELRDILNHLAGMDWDRAIRNSYHLWSLYERKYEALSAPASTGDPAETLKQKVIAGQKIKRSATSREDFIRRPFLGRRALHAKASRKYGVEFEVIDAGDLRWPDETHVNTPGDLITAREVILPPGWTKDRDGSLRSQIGDGYFYDPWEFISPPMTRTFDPGMRSICEQIDWTVPYAKAGVHVHVDATNAKGQRMTSAQVNRLLEIYAQVSPLLPPILRRSTAEFCQQMDFGEWALGWWRRPYTPPKRPHRKAQLANRPADARTPVPDNPLLQVRRRMDDYNRHQPKNWGRYREVNLESLVKHGTIEFRAMGAVYGFEYICRWAWLCREMVNYAQSNMSIEPFYRFVTLGEVMDHIEATAVERLAPIKERKWLSSAA